MKKSRFLALVLVVAVMMMGAGYAYWTQNLTITNTIKTGVLDVVFTDPDLEIDTYMDDDSDIDLNGNHGLTLSLVDAYPGAEVTVYFTLDNEGTMEANVRGFEIADGAVKAELVLCKSITVDNTTTDFSEGTTLAEALEDLNINVEDENEVDVEMVIQIDPDANSDSTSALYLEEGSETPAISFTINATVHQYNDNE